LQTPGVQQHIPPRDAEIDDALTDIRRDIPRAQVVELDQALAVYQHQILGVDPLPVPSGTKHRDGALSQGSLVRHR